MCQYEAAALLCCLLLMFLSFLLLDMFTNRHDTARHPQGVIWFTICFEDMYNRFSYIFMLVMDVH
jgi:hypothetical protein